MSEFLHMGGYALYVWGSFGVAALLLALEPIFLRSRCRSVRSRVKRLIRMQSEG